MKKKMTKKMFKRLSTLLLFVLGTYGDSILNGLHTLLLKANPSFFSAIINIIIAIIVIFIIDK